ASGNPSRLLAAAERCNGVSSLVACSSSGRTAPVSTPSTTTPLPSSRASAFRGPTLPSSPLVSSVLSRPFSPSS
ncbi:hypothetical protein LTR39_001570, partial [Cryomyces antarcticus]